MNNIIAKNRGLYPFSDETLEALTSHLERRVIPPKSIIIHAGKLDRTVYFIERGITRSYVLHDGKEITTWFCMEGDIACGSMDLYLGKPGFEYVETIEECEVYSITVEALNQLFEQHIDLANWMRRLMQHIFLKLQDAHIARLILPAQERYENFLRDFPDISSRVNLGHIASFLGVTQQSLSRIRGFSHR